MVFFREWLNQRQYIFNMLISFKSQVHLDLYFNVLERHLPGISDYVFECRTEENPLLIGIAMEELSELQADVIDCSLLRLAPLNMFDGLFPDWTDFDEDQELTPEIKQKSLPIVEKIVEEIKGDKNVL